MASEEEDQDLESLRVAVLASLKTKSQQASPSNDAASQSPNCDPDATEEKMEAGEEEEDQDEDALRRAALKSTKEVKLEDIPRPPTPQPTFKLTGNLIAIQPAPEEPAPAQLNPNDRPKLPRSNKFARFAMSNSESSSNSDDDSSEEDSDDDGEDAKNRQSSDSSKNSSDNSSSSSDSGSDSSSRSSSASRSSSSSSSSSSSCSSSSGSSSSDSSDSETSDSDDGHKLRDRDSERRSSIRKRHGDGDNQRRHSRKERPLERSERERDRKRRISPYRDRERDSWSSRQRGSLKPGKDIHDYRSNPNTSHRDNDHLRTRSRSPRSRRDERGLRTRPDGTRGFGISDSKVPSINEPLESRLRRLAAHEDSRLDRKRDARELLSSRKHRSGETRTERGVRRQSSNTSKKTDEKVDSKVSSPKTKRTSSGSGTDSSVDSDISLSDLESDSDKETSRFKHAKGEKPQGELSIRRKPAARSYRDGFSRDDRRDDRRREERRRRGDDRYQDDRRQRESGRSRDDRKDRDLIRKRDGERQRNERIVPKSRNGPISMVKPKMPGELLATKAEIPSLLDIKIRNPNMDTKMSSSRLEPSSPIHVGRHRNRSFSPGKKLTSPDPLKILDKNFESESGSDGEAVPTGPRSIVKVDKRRDLKSRLGKRATATHDANHDLPDEDRRRKKERDRKTLTVNSKERESRKGRSRNLSEKDTAGEEKKEVNKEPKIRDGSPEIRITFNEGPPSKRKPVHERLGLKASSKPRRSVKDRLGKMVPLPKEPEPKKHLKDSVHQPDLYEDEDPLEGQVRAHVATKPRQSVIELKTQTKRDAESKRQAEKHKQLTEGRQSDKKTKHSEDDSKHQTEDSRHTKDEIGSHTTEAQHEDASKVNGESNKENSVSVKHPNNEASTITKGGEILSHVETQDENKHVDEIDIPTGDIKKQEVPAELKRKTKIKLRRSSGQKTKTDDIKASILREEEEEEMASEDVRVSVSREEEKETSDHEPPREVIQSQSPRSDDRKVISENKKSRRNIVSAESDGSGRQIVYAESERSSRNVVPADYDTSKRKIVHGKPDNPDLADSEAPHRKILHDDSRHSRRKVYQSDLDSSQRKIIHDEQPPRRKILQSDSDSSRRKVFQTDLHPPRRTVFKDSDIKRGLSPTSSYEDIRRPKMSRGGELWKRGCIEERTREVEIKMEQEERKVIEETREEEAKRRKEEELNAKIRKIKEKNAAILQRHKEIEAEKIMFGS